MPIGALRLAPKLSPEQKAAQRAALVEAPGRKRGQTPGTHVTDLASLQKAIVLCGLCKNRFDEKFYGYFREKNLAVQGRCDGCNEHSAQATLFVHETLLGQSWTPRRAR